MNFILEKNEISSKLDIYEPLLIINKINIKTLDKTARAIQSINKKDWFFKCHLPNKPVMPAALTIEGMLQTLALLIYSTVDHSFEKAYIVDIKTKLLSSITEVDSEIIYDAKLSSFKRGISKGTVEVFSNNKKKGKGEFVYASPSLMQLPN
tara:strand:+ start:314 stop:766 length:453 start_codon:yes stop_codon:yes gene_type:complete